MSPLDAFGRAGTVLLLGGNSDIGKAIVRQMISEGAHTVVLAGRDIDTPLSEMEALVEHRYFDATDTASHDKFFDEVFADHPGIDAVVFAFGVLHAHQDVELDPGVGVEMVEVNYVGTVSALLRCYEHLRRRGGGQLVVLSSVAGLRPRRSNYVYGSSKAGIDFLARGLAHAGAETDVHVLIVRPGFVHTAMTKGMTPRLFAVSADTVARSVVDGLRRRARVIYVPQILKWVMGLVRLLPSSLVDRLDS